MNPGALGLTPAALRDALEGLVIKGLLGPAGGPEEEVDEPRIHDRFLVGKLEPINELALPRDQADELAVVASDGPAVGNPEPLRSILTNRGSLCAGACAGVPP